MSVCAVMLVRDEADILPDTLGWLTTQVDEIIAMDNGSIDGTYELLLAHGAHVIRDGEVAYLQSAKTSLMGQMAKERGHQWVLPCDADEIWHCGTIDRPIRDYLGGVSPDVAIVRANLYNHIPTTIDAEDDSPVRRIGFRQREHAPLPKVCARTSLDLVIEPGNHGAHYSTYEGTALWTGGLNVRHYSWRSEEQYVRKIRNGREAYAAAGDLLDSQLGVHWRMWEGHEDEAIAAHYRKWFLIDAPFADDTLIFDPFPR